MKRLSFVCAAALLASACAITPEEHGIKGEFQPPLVYQQWHTQYYTLQDGAKGCTISSGYNGLVVSLRQGPDSVIAAVASTRRMEPGATLTVSASGRNFEAYDSSFPPKIAPELVETLAKGGKAYVEWSEVNGPSGRERAHTQNILKLDDFSARLDECRKSLRR